MLFNRQKLLLALLQSLGGNLGATDFQKYLFLYTIICEKEKSYNFVPYRFGCYSFQAVADKQKLINNGYLSNVKGWELAKPNLNYLHPLSKNDEKKVKMFTERYKSLHGKSLINHVYTEYPYYAINSEIAKDNLNPEELELVNAAKPKKRRKPIFATIGYEGGSIETYLNKLIQHDIRVLIDVRKNSISRKYGFSKKTLSSTLYKVGIKYIHIPELGIDSSKRKVLNNQSDYDRLFDEYEKTVLKSEINSVEELFRHYIEHKRIAITCFEKDHCQCHRSKVADAVKLLSDGDMEIQHI